MSINLNFDVSPGSYRTAGSIHELFEARVRETPAGKLSIDGEEMTLKELNERADRAASLLKSKGVGPGVVTAVLLKPSLGMLTALLGIWKAGGACLPIDPEVYGPRVHAMVEEARASLLLADSGLIKHSSFTALQRLRLLDPAALHVTAPRPVIKDFDSLPLPDRGLVDYEKYTDNLGLGVVKNCITMQATRGCPYKCAYCHKLWPKTHVVRSAENIFSEVKHYYDMGVRRFSFIDDIFNLDIKNSRRFFQLAIKNKLDAHFLFPSGLRADILTEDYIDLMVEAGTIHMALAVETASPRLQKLIQKNMDLDKLQRMAEYICAEYPEVLFNLFSMVGFPSETEEEAYMTLDFVKRLRWVHFVFISILKVYPNTDMEKLALEHGFSRDEILGSEGLLFHQLSDGGQFGKSFTHKYQAEFLNDYFLKKERLLHVLPHQMKVLTEDEVVKKYDSFLPAKIDNFNDLLQAVGITREELGTVDFLEEDKVKVTDLNRKMREVFPVTKPDPDALRVLLLDATLDFSDKDHHYYDLVEAPLGLMNLLTYLNRELGPRIHGQIAKSRVDFDSFQELKELIHRFKPDVIGIRTLSNYRDFFHGLVAAVRQFGTDAPIIAGGPYATSNYRVLLRDPNVDLVVPGEGEITFKEVIDKILENNHRLPGPDVLKEIKGIVFPSRRVVPHYNPVREIILWDQYNEQLFHQSPADTEPAQTRGADSVPACVGFVSAGAGGDRPLGVMVDHQTLLERISRGDPWTDAGALQQIIDTARGDSHIPADALKAQEAFWRKELEGAVPTLNLITDFEPPVKQNMEGAKLVFELSREKTAALEESARRCDIPFSSLLQAVYCVLLFKLTLQEDIVTGFPVTGEKHVSPRQVLSSFTVTLPIRIRIDGDESFESFARQVHRTIDTAYENRQFPVETLAESMGGKLYDTLLAVQTMEFDDLENGELSDARKTELQAMPYGYEPLHSPLPLVFTAVEVAQRVFFSVLYRTKLFKEETILRWIDYFNEIIDAVSDNGNIKIKDISVSHDFLEPETTLLQEADADFDF
jgi:radical SAM superfamily enzyme YgiQ (UPF0313 family)